jgi:hypothetical protein
VFIGFIQKNSGIIITQKTVATNTIQVIQLFIIKNNRMCLQSIKSKCFYCGVTTFPTKLWNKDKVKLRLRTRDHIIPLAKRGRNVAENIVFACHKCNSSKGMMELSEFADSVKSEYTKSQVFKLIEYVNTTHHILSYT